ncbi:MAG: sugar-binding transcriptional regulator [Dongiaceae bacterium]
MARKKQQVEADDGDLGLAVRAAWLSYVGGRTQAQIAARLHISQAKAHRLIAEAQQRGLVKVFIQGEPAECIALEDRLATDFGLRQCIVAPNLEIAGGSDARRGSDAGSRFQALGSAGARLLHHELSISKPGVLGVAKGRTLAAVVDHLPEINLPDTKIVSVTGSLTRNLSAYPFDVVLRLAERTGGSGYFLPVPYLAGNIGEKTLLLQQQSIRAVLDLAREADILLVGIGSLDAEAHLRQVEIVTESEWTDLRAHGAVGDLLGTFIDIDGRPVPLEINKLAVGLGLDELRGRRVIAFAGGVNKAAPILAALRTGLITDLVIDESTAAKVAALQGQRAADLRAVESQKSNNWEKHDA